MSAWWVRLGRHALPHSSGLGTVLVLMLVGVAFDALRPWPMKILVDSVLAGRPLPEGTEWIASLPGGSSSAGLIAWLALAGVVLFLALRLTAILQSYLQSGVGTQMVYSLGGELFTRLQQLSLGFHSRRRVGDMVRRVVNDSTCAQSLVISVALPVLTAIATLVVMFTVMWRLDSSLALFAIIVTPILGILIRLFDRPMMENTYRQQQLEGEMMALAEQTLTAMPAVQAFGREERNDADFRQLSQRTLQAYLTATRSQLQFKVGVSGVSAVGTALVILLGGFHVLAGALTLGSLLVFLSYLASLYVPIETLAYSSAGFASAAAGARRVLEVLDSEEMVKEEPGAPALPVVRGHVRFEEVTVGYESGRPVLHEISIEAHPGETIALVGPTGAGKSTLVSLIPRFFDPWSGRVSIDGHDVRSVQLKSLRAQIALVLQEPFLLPLSAAENIAYGRPGATREEVEAAARAANADEFITRLPEGYDTVLGERGATLSGGERQRLSIARALLKDAPILILDEPTSALDAGTEALLLEALERLMSGRTTFIIAHRLSTIRGADRIVVIENGRAVEQGTHQELIAAGGTYQRFQPEMLRTIQQMTGENKA